MRPGIRDSHTLYGYTQELTPPGDRASGIVFQRVERKLIKSNGPLRKGPAALVRT